MSSEHDVITVREFMEFRGDFKEFRATMEAGVESLQKGQEVTIARLDRLNGQTVTHAKALAVLPCLQHDIPTPCRTKAIEWRHPAVIAGATVTMPMVFYSLFEFGKAVVGLFK